MAFSLPVGAPVKVQKISWLDPERNEFREGTFFDARVEKADFFKFQLSDARFPRTTDGTRLAFEPMGNVAHRVILVRPLNERMLFKGLTVVFVVLLVLAAGAGAIDLKRRS